MHVRTASALVVVAAGVAALAALALAACGGARDGSYAAELREDDGLPCAPRLVLQRTCQSCHASPPRGGAPFPLVTWRDTRELVDGEPMAEHMRRAVESGRMPIGPSALSEEGRDTLLAWLRAGGPRRPAGELCE